MDRKPDYEIDKQFLQRWSPRSMNGEALSEGELMQVLEAARWAPSSANLQPWRFIYALPGSDSFVRLFNLLAEPNKAWCARAGALLLIVSKKTFDDGRVARTHTFDAGAAWMSLALQAHLLGLVAHGMAGFNYDLARTELAVPDDFDIEAMVALGHPGNVEDLPEAYQAREMPGGRRPIRESIYEGKFGSLATAP
jgi:nitroreductase